jgi:PST family polysaccharide transporter
LDTRSHIGTDPRHAAFAREGHLRADHDRLVEPLRTPHSYVEILKSSALIGASSALNVIIGIVRTKLMAVLLGPAGFGMLAIYSSIADVARTVAEMGINSSGVRQIAEAAGSGDEARIGRVITILRRTSVVLGVSGAAFLLLFSDVLSRLSFGSAARSSMIALLSLAVLFRLLSDAQAALIQGLRRIGDLAKISVLGALVGTLVAIPVVYIYGEDGVVPSLVSMAGVSLAVSWWYSARIPIRRQSIKSSEVRGELGGLLKLGLAFMVSGFVMMGTAYVIRVIVFRHGGGHDAGLYQAAWTLAGLYVGFVLQAMGTDFYPRLVAAGRDNRECNRLVNEQAHVSLLLAGPGVIATLVFASMVILAFYSSQFEAAVGVLRWMCLGMALRVVSWPMGFIIVARGERALFVGTEVAWGVVSVGLAVLCIERFGLTGTGIAFFGSYVFHTVMLYPIVRSRTGFRWSAANRRDGLFFGSLATSVSLAQAMLSPLQALTIGGVAVVLAAAYSVRMLLVLVSLGSAPMRVRQLLGRMCSPRTRVE